VPCILSRRLHLYLSPIRLYGIYPPYSPGIVRYVRQRGRKRKRKRERERERERGEQNEGGDEGIEGTGENDGS